MRAHVRGEGTHVHVFNVSTHLHVCPVSFFMAHAAEEGTQEPSVLTKPQYELNLCTNKTPLLTKPLCSRGGNTGALSIFSSLSISTDLY